MNCLDGGLVVSGNDGQRWGLVVGSGGRNLGFKMMIAVEVTEMVVVMMVVWMLAGVWFLFCSVTTPTEGYQLVAEDMLTGFRGQHVELTFNTCSTLYHEVISKCSLLHGRYLATPWLTSPHLQTTFLRFFGRPPVFNYRREVFNTGDGGIVALDWLARSDVVENEDIGNDELHQDANTPIVIVIPGLTSDSDSVYIKHLTFYMAKRGWNVVVSNHRGLGGVPLTSDFFYTGGWTNDLRKVVEHIRSQSPDVPLFVVGTSLGANMMVKYLGEDGDDILIDGAAAVCCPWDLLLCNRFIGRNAVQRFYDRALGAGLKRYAKKHQEFFTRLADWDGIEKARRVREFDTSGTCLVAKFDTADTYYRESSCVGYVGRIKVPLLCISALDDPVCTKEALIWDECRVNKNIILATTQHGGHLGYFDGTDAKGVWWVRAVDEYLTVLGSSTMIRRQNKMPDSMLIRPQKSLVNKDPYIGYVKKTENQIHVDNLTKMTKILKITDAQGSETSSRVDSIIFFLKRSWISFSKRKI
ncbi:AB hydrolase 4 family, Serine aminopeptidase, S33 [Artemisia annua]|uniref:AB hydrolase 4 family, Serine aminopeptidase, S33 n=1 Tax=Artemisia annua TaxID=35608 RepID=A0A2U1LD38_ARTAN|nr:AB hydrolase 4 family, Serine aminopeptidase, S33 [Artemisia annua]